MGFKDILNDDLNNVFFLTEEFAEMHTIDNIEMSIIIDDDGLEELKNLRNADYDGIYISRIMFYVKKKDFGKKPAIDSIIDFDNKSYCVKSATEDANMLKIILGWDEE